MKRRTSVVPKKQSTDAVPSDLTETEEDLISHLQNGYQLETDSLGGDPLLRGGEDKEVIRPLSATRKTVKALEERRLIAPAKSSGARRRTAATNAVRSYRISDGVPNGVPKLPNEVTLRTVA